MKFLALRLLQPPKHYGVFDVSKVKKCSLGSIELMSSIYNYLKVSFLNTSLSLSLAKVIYIAIGYGNFILKENYSKALSNSVW